MCCNILKSSQRNGKFAKTSLQIFRCAENSSVCCSTLSFAGLNIPFLFSSNNLQSDYRTLADRKYLNNKIVLISSFFLFSKASGPQKWKRIPYTSWHECQMSQWSQSERFSMFLCSVSRIEALLYIVWLLRSFVIVIILHSTFCETPSIQ